MRECIEWWVQRVAWYVEKWVDNKKMRRDGVEGVL